MNEAMEKQLTDAMVKAEEGGRIKGLYEAADFALRLAEESDGPHQKALRAFAGLLVNKARQHHEAHLSALQSTTDSKGEKL